METTLPLYFSLMKSATCLLSRAALIALTASVFSLPSLTARMLPYAEEEPSLNRESLTGLRPAFIA